MKALLVILGVIGAVLAVALALLLIWRVLATVQVRMSVTCTLITILSGSIRRETTISSTADFLWLFLRRLVITSSLARQKLLLLVN